MTNERVQSILEELGEVQTMAELKAIHCFGGDYADARFTEPFKQAVKKLRPLNEALRVPEPIINDDVMNLKIAEMQAEIDRLRDATPQPPTKTSVQRIERVGRKYRLLSTDVSWSTKPQVQAIVAILGAHAKLGDVLDEGDIVKMMVANEAVLRTKQGGKRIWDYYKGDHFEGLAAHRNVEKV